MIIFWLLVFSVLIGVYAEKLNRNGAGYFVLSLLISPLITIILLLILGENNEAKQKQH